MIDILGRVAPAFFRMVVAHSLGIDRKLSARDPEIFVDGARSKLTRDEKCRIAGSIQSARKNRNRRGVKTHAQAVINLRAKLKAIQVDLRYREGDTFVRLSTRARNRRSRRSKPPTNKESTMERKGLVSAFTVALAVFTQACSSSSISPPVVPPQMLYVSNANTPGAVSLFQLPLTSSSAPSGSLNNVGNIPVGICASSSGMLVVTAPGSTEVQAWSSPASGASPSFNVALAAGLDPEGCAFDAAGNLYIANSIGSILVYPTFSQGSSAGTPIISGINTPVGVATDSGGNVYVADNHTITIYGPLSGGNTLLHTISGVNGATGIKIGPDGNMYAANFTTAGKIDVFVPPFVDTSTFNHQISPPGATDLRYLAFDRAGNLYVTAANGSAAHSGIYVYAPPYTGTPVELDVVAEGLEIR
jgi:hypothetical protein